MRSYLASLRDTEPPLPWAQCTLSILSFLFSLPLSIVLPASRSSACLSQPCFHSFSIFLRLDAIELLRKYISSDSRSGGKRSDTVPTHWFDAIFTWNGVEEITVKARIFAFVEISRMPLLPLYFFPPLPLSFLTPLFLTSNAPLTPPLSLSLSHSLPPLSGLSSQFQNQFVYL